MSSYWREKAMECIAVVQQEHPDAQGVELRALLSAAYPFGQRKYHPYKIWLDCVQKVCRIPKRSKPIETLPLFAVKNLVS